MKLCLLCGALSPDDAVTCRNDGEASWSTAAPVASDDAQADDAGSASDDAPKKRARKAVG